MKYTVNHNLRKIEDFGCGHYRRANNCTLAIHIEISIKLLEAVRLRVVIATTAEKLATF